MSQTDVANVVSIEEVVDSSRESSASPATPFDDVGDHELEARISKGSGDWPGC